MTNVSPKDNYLMMIRGEIPAYLPSVAEQVVEGANTPWLTPMFAPNGPVYSQWGVRFVGSPENFYGAMPEPGFIILHDITEWRDKIKNPDFEGYDWEAFFKDPKVFGERDRANKVITARGGDYFQSLVSFMGFENALLAMYEEPEEVYELFDYLSEHYITVLKNTIYYTRPELYSLADDTAAQNSPFVSPAMYKQLLKPFYKRLTDIAQDADLYISHHNCGRCEAFIDDWMDLGIVIWNPAQTTNDLVVIKYKYGDRLAMQGCWDNTGYISSLECSDDEMMAALYRYVDTFAPNGRFVYSAGLHGNPEDERYKRKKRLLDMFYQGYAKDWYSWH